MGKLRSDKTLNPRFLKSEIDKMEKIVKENKDKILDEGFYKKVTEELNVASGRTKCDVIPMERVQTWFESNRDCQANEGASSPTASKDPVPSDTSLSNDAPESLNFPKDTEEKAPEVKEFEFEAKSARDDAWYDVSTFLAARNVHSGDLEVRVRFKDFGAEDDEWVNVKQAVRERSIPLDKSDCTKVAIGDLVLCFREDNEQAMYFDARITGIERRLHDIRGCRCLFSVRYNHDQFEETVTSRRVCRRPIIT